MQLIQPLEINVFVQLRNRRFYKVSIRQYNNMKKNYINQFCEDLRSFCRTLPWLDISSPHFSKLSPISNFQRLLNLGFPEVPACISIFCTGFKYKPAYIGLSVQTSHHLLCYYWSFTFTIFLFQTSFWGKPASKFTPH